MEQLIIRGHGLISEGAAYTAQSCQDWPCDKVSGVQRVDRRGVVSSNGVGGHGHALCACGWTGPHAFSGAERRRQHRGHKQKIRGIVPA